ncbi:MAG: rhodanese-like domain-containing protein [Mycobacteriaceae bacterium]
MSYAGDITPEQAWKLLTENPHAVLVDVRTDAEWRYVGVPDTSAINRTTVFVEWVSYPAGQPNSHFISQLNEAGIISADSGEDRPIIFLCRSGQRSIGAAVAATAAGITPAYNILDGFEGGLDSAGHRGSVGWRANGLPWRQS